MARTGRPEVHTFSARLVRVGMNFAIEVPLAEVAQAAREKEHDRTGP